MVHAGRVSTGLHVGPCPKARHRTNLSPRRARRILFLSAHGGATAKVWNTPLSGPLDGEFVIWVETRIADRTSRKGASIQPAGARPSDQGKPAEVTSPN